MNQDLDDDLDLDSLDDLPPTLPAPAAAPESNARLSESERLLRTIHEILGVPADTAQVTAHFSELPSVAATVGQKAAEAVRDSIIEKANLASVRAVAAASARANGEASGKRVTDAQVEAAVNCDPGVVGAVEQYAHAEYLKELWRRVLTALEYKRDALINMGANGRVELGAIQGSTIRAPNRT